MSTVFAIVLATTGSSLADDEQDEYAVKVGYLYNFCNYVRWPSYVAPNALTIGVIGPAIKDASIADTIRELNEQPVANRKIQLREFATVDNYRPCDMLYVTGASQSELEALTKIARSTAKMPILIVSEMPDGLKYGASINFVRVGKTIKLEINRAASEQAQLSINAKLLRLAINTGQD